VDQRYLGAGRIMTKLAAENTLVGHVIEQYNTYKEYQHYYRKPNNLIDLNLDPSGIPCHWYSADTQINADSSDVVVIDLMTEGLHAALSRFHTYDKNKKYILFSNGWWDTEKYDFGFKYELCDYNYFQHDYVTQAANPRNMNYFVDKQYQFESDKHNLFCCLVGSRRAGREYFVKNILSNLSDIDFILNYHGMEFGKSSRVNDISYDFPNYNSYKPFDSTGFYTISNSMPMDIYNSAKFNLIVETNSNLQYEFHLTEKTIKSFLVGIPFVILSSSGFLKRLRKLGFRTYSEIWSEEYDEIENFEDRVTEIIKLIKDLNLLDWVKCQNQLKEISIHNKMNLMYNNTTLKAQLENIGKVFSEI
jgi:hypothetical protein